jgi:hypothetical protein
MYSISEKEGEEVKTLENKIFASNGVPRYSRVEVECNAQLTRDVRRLQYLYLKMEELYSASCN